MRPEWLHGSLIEDILVAPDHDAEGDDGAQKLCRQSSHIRMTDHVPAGKDLTEYYQAGGDILKWLLDQLEHIPCQRN